MDMTKTGKSSLMPLLIVLVTMYMLTGLLLVILAAALGRMQLSDSAVSIGIIATYIISCFVGGFLIGKKKKRKKYAWGLCIGIFYFLVLLLGCLIVNRSLSGQTAHMLTTAALCILSAMAGGMAG